MRSAVALIGAACMALAACSATRPQGGVARAASGAPLPPVRLVVLGDSLALGTGASDTSGGFAFRIFLALEAHRPKSRITNIAIGGTLAADVLRLEVPRLRDVRADAILLCAGGNDVVRATPPAQFARTYASLLTAIARAAPRTPIVVVGVPDVSISPLFSDHAAAVHALSRADDRAARAAAARIGARYVDLFALTAQARNTPGFLSSDRFHPSDEGHARIASLVLPDVRRALADNIAVMKTR